MTLIAGIYGRETSGLISDAQCAAVRQAISRESQDVRHEFRNQRAYFVKIDIGAFAPSGFIQDGDRSIALLTGEPLLTDVLGRERDLLTLRDACLTNDWEVVSKTRGVYAAAVYQPTNHRLVLLVDKLGLRPLYCCIAPQYVFFASALRVLEDLIGVPKRIDIRGVSELIGLGTPLGDRTPYADIFLLNAGEVIELTDSRVDRRRYWNWIDVPQPSCSVDELAQRSYDQFARAIKRRIKSDKSTIAYLSGGLDSRCVVTELVSQNVQVHTFNFAIKGSQDQVFGNLFASEIGTLHTDHPRPAGTPSINFSKLMADAWGESPLKDASPPEHPQLVWSGEGGSVGLGHVHLDQRVVDLLREGRRDDAINHFLHAEKFRLPLRVFTRAMAIFGDTVLKEGIEEQVLGVHCSDPGRIFYVFLMLNDQRRKLHRHFEDIDSHRLEFQLPFFDSDFVMSILHAPIDLCLGHGFYSKFLTYFDNRFLSAPWQTYPGHDPCPVPHLNSGSYQWSDKHVASERGLRSRALANDVSSILKSKKFPQSILNRKRVRIANWAHRLGVRNYEYVLEAALTYEKYFRRCERSGALDTNAILQSARNNVAAAQKPYVNSSDNLS